MASSWRRFTRIAPVLTLSSLGLSCATEEISAPTSDEPPRPSAGCGTQAPVAPGESGDLSIRVGDLDREYRLHLPPSYDRSRATALVLDFHGYTGSAPTEEAYTGLSRHADEHGYVVVYPQGTGFVGSSGDLITSWNDLAGNASPGPQGPICSESAVEYDHPPECGEPTPCNWATCHDDLTFVVRLLDRLESELCVDLDRVYATGMSNGGMFVHRLGCEIPERFAAIAPVGGTRARGFNCAPTSALSMMNVYGSRDIYVSQRGDESSDGYYYEAAEAVMSKWAARAAQDCDPTTSPYPTSRDGELDLACVQHAHCSTGAEVVHCEWDGAHDWPQAEDLGNDLIWRFFSKHTRSSYVAARRGEGAGPP